MKKFVLYFNEEYLPSGPNDAQIILYLTLPAIQKYCISAPLYIGYNYGVEHSELAFVIFGFGLIYNRNWDV